MKKVSKPLERAAIALLLVLTAGSVAAQDDSAAAVHKYLPDITVVGRHSKSDYQQMPEVVGVSIYAGKKNALIVLDNVQGNVVTNNMRQVLAKVPGIHVWESDPSGIQIGIAARGLSPNRSWEFNVRQNGYDIAADPFGYPEAYYNPQLQAVQRIEVVRGHGSLQYGPQFGGLVNYILRNGSEINLPFEFETQQTIGSNGLFNSYNALGGERKNFHYYTFFDHRNGNGWRENSRYYTNSGFATFTYKLHPRLSLSVEIMRYQMRSQQPGGATDSMLYANARKSLRSRNWFDITWTTPALILNYRLSEKAKWNTKLFATLGDRNSVGFLQSITVKDSINASTLNYNSREVLIDNYRNYGMESRLLFEYAKHTFSGGIRLYTGTTHRRSGRGTTGTDYDFTVTGGFQRDIDFDSRNAAVFAENIFRLTKKLIIVPGIRWEWLEGAASGINNTINGVPQYLQNVRRSRGFLLMGAGAEFHIGNTEVYANFTQAYRPIQFANLQAPPTTDVVDPYLEDAKGYNADLGYRGKLKDYLQFDLSGYYLNYDNRIGTVTVNGVRLITNVGGSISRGIEAYVEFNPARAFGRSRKADLIVFGSYAYTLAKYDSDHKDAATKGKRVENAPEHIFRGGISAGYKSALVTLQLSYVGETFSDANNTLSPAANGNVGLIPSYTLTDLTASYKLTKMVNLKAGINNLFDVRYFTRRAGGYPGPGALAGDGRTVFLSVGARIR
ncbi:MAG TPA: TonB-dependent receptor [Chitinophagaceae bacterium]|nr:TonB-dependent receptor [Chitinophagaceae bacterium]